MKIWKSRIWGIIFWPLSSVYGFLVWVRNRLYEMDILHQTLLNAAVISVGNVTVGGTGKTPMVEKVSRILSEKGYRVAVLSRGYRRKGKGIVVVSNGENVIATPEQAGDEPLLLAKHLPKVPVLVNRNRAESGRLAEERWGIEVLILDDGFQHRKVQRDLDLVVVDSTTLFGNSRLLPAGPLREPLNSLKRADVIVFTRVNECDNWEDGAERIKRVSSATVFSSVHRPLEWVSIGRQGRYSLDHLYGKRVVACSGIGNPDSFIKTLESLEVDVVRFLRYQDHHWYNEGDLRKIFRTAMRIGVEAVVVSEKDAVRMPVSRGWEIPFYFLRIELEIQNGDQEFMSLLHSVLKLKRNEG